MEPENGSSVPRPGDVWWCGGDALGFGDGGKVRPVLVITVDAADADVIPLTTRKPANKPVAITHNAGFSWMTDAHRRVPLIDLVSSLGYWPGYDAWRRKHS